MPTLDKFIPYAGKFLDVSDPVKIDFVSDKDNSDQILGKTAYYDPNDFKITIYVDNRHFKDILRSLSHELVHHAQNCRGDLDKITNNSILNDQELQNREAEAYMLGNGFIVRFFEEELRESQQLSESIKKRKVKIKF